MENYKDYGWQKPSTLAHNYLMPDILSIFKELNFDQRAFILDAGAGGRGCSWNVI